MFTFISENQSQNVLIVDQRATCKDILPPPHAGFN
jgi:hypothetical protein